MRVILGAFLLLAVAAGVAHAEWKQPPVVDLNKPGALDRVERDNPRHYRQILAIIRTMQEKSCEEVLRLYKASHDFGVSCSAHMLMTSWPAKRHLSVVIDGVRYMKAVPIHVPMRHFKVEPGDGN